MIGVIAGVRPEAARRGGGDRRPHGPPRQGRRRPSTPAPTTTPPASRRCSRSPRAFAAAPEQAEAHARASRSGPARRRASSAPATGCGTRSGRSSAPTAYLNLDMIGHPWRRRRSRKLVADTGLPDGEEFLAQVKPADFVEPGLPLDAPELAAVLRRAGPADRARAAPRPHRRHERRQRLPRLRPRRRPVRPLLRELLPRLPRARRHRRRARRRPGAAHGPPRASPPPGCSPTAEARAGRPLNADHGVGTQLEANARDLRVRDSLHAVRGRQARRVDPHRYVLEATRRAIASPGAVTLPQDLT